MKVQQKYIKRLKRANVPDSVINSMVNFYKDYHMSKISDDIRIVVRVIVKVYNSK